MSPEGIVGLVVGVLAILAAAWRLTRTLYRLARIAETALDRLTNVEAQLKNNGGNSARDVLDKIHTVAVENQEANARVEEGQKQAATKAAEAARLAGAAGMTASRTEQRLNELAATTDVRHAENVARLDALEDNDEDARIQRELLLHVLRHKHGIDLIDDEDVDADGSDGDRE